MPQDVGGDLRNRQYPPWKLGALRTHVVALVLTTPAEEQVDVAEVGADNAP
jgi:hypothetical protein